jgi:hypothetical protein
MDLREIGWNSVVSVNETQDRDQWSALVNRVMNFRSLYETGNFLSS